MEQFVRVEVENICDARRLRLVLQRASHHLVQLLNGLEDGRAIGVPLLKAPGQVIHSLRIELHLIDDFGQEVLDLLRLLSLADMQSVTMTHILNARDSMPPLGRNNLQRLIHLGLYLLPQYLEIEEHDDAFVHVPGAQLPLGLIDEVEYCLIELLCALLYQLLLHIADLNLNLLDLFEFHHVLY